MGYLKQKKYIYKTGYECDKQIAMGHHSDLNSVT